MVKVIQNFVLLLMLFASPVSGQIVEDTNISVIASPGGFVLSVLQTPESNDHTDIIGSTSVAGSTAMLLFEGFSLDEGSEWFATNQLDVFTRDTIVSGQFNLLGSLAVEVNQSFFLGVNTGSGFVGNDYASAANRQHFGWGEFLIDQDGELQLLDSAVAYDRNGILIGTSVAVPEPSSAFLILTGSAFFILRRSRLATTHIPRCPNA